MPNSIENGLPTLMYGDKEALAPQFEDLNRLYKLICAKGSGRILEFGCGYSTLVIAAALERNREYFGKTYRPGMPWILNVVDTNADWLKHVYGHLKELDLDKGVVFYHSECRVAIINEQMCHLYDNLPSIVPDFIYLDGPDPKQVQGSLYGMTFGGRRQPMAADILMMEPFFFPDSFILVDGRQLNARFLKNNLKRNWAYTESLIDGYTTFQLKETGHE